MKQTARPARIALAVHGGAGTIERSKMTAEREQEYRAGIEHALRAGRDIPVSYTHLTLPTICSV